MEVKGDGGQRIEGGTGVGIHVNVTLLGKRIRLSEWCVGWIRS